MQNFDFRSWQSDVERFLYETGCFFFMGLLCCCNAQASSQAYYSVTADADIRREETFLQNCCRNVKHYIFHCAHLSHVKYNTALPRFCSGGKTTAAWSKKPFCARVTGMVGLAEKAQPDSDGWWLLHSHRALRDWGLFVPTNGIVHIFYSNPWLKLKNRPTLCATDIKTHGQCGSQTLSKTKG